MICNESDFIVRLRQGEEAALDYIVDTYLPIVKGTVFKILISGSGRQQAEECVNDIFLSVWQHREQFQGSDSLEFKKWVYKIAKFKAIDYYRKNCTNKEYPTLMEVEPVDINAHQEMNRMESREEVLKLIEKLSETDRNIFLMKYFLGMNSEQIARKLSMTHSAIDNRLHKGRKNFLKNMKKGRRFPYERYV